MAATPRDANFEAWCKADDPDVWMRPETKSDGFKHWSYVLVYTDNLLAGDSS
jgi:hypothetical protein